MALARQAASAAQWSQRQYEVAVGSPERVALVIVEHLAVAGFVVARVLDMEWEIENIVVAGDLRRRGLGARLLTEIIKLARQRKADAIFLEVRESNAAARSFYEKNALVQSGRRRYYYHQPDEDALIYGFAIL
jgi:[ribosomal protein S18]-alanine N-acetyltransferase